MIATADAGPRHIFRWELAGTILCGLVLLGWGWRDLRTYLRHRNDHEASIEMLERGGDWFGQNEFFRTASTLVKLGNIGYLEKAPDHRFRHALGPASSIELWSQLKAVKLSFKYDNILPDQHLTVTYNGKVIEDLEHLPAGKIDRTYRLDVVEGDNVFTVAFGLYNHHEVEISPADGRPIAGDFLDLNVEF